MVVAVNRNGEKDQDRSPSGVWNACVTTGRCARMSKQQMRRIESFSLFRMGCSGLMTDGSYRAHLVIKRGLMWRYTSKGYGPHKTIYNRFIR
jgi:hypothetical protein